MPPKQADIVCKFCEQSVEQVQTALSDPQTVDTIRRQADQFCEFLKVVDADKECRQLMHKYLNQALKFIQDIDPQAYCRSIQLCPAPSPPRPLAKKSSASRSHVLNSQAATNGKQQNRLPTLADFNNFGIETSVIIGDEQATQERKANTKSPNCMLCKTFVAEMFHFLRNNKTEANIVSGLDKVCQLIYKGDSLEQCKSLVNSYTKELIQLLVDETDPELICILLEQCVGHKESVYQVVPQARPETREKKPEASHRKMDLGDLIHYLDPTVKLKSAKVCFECKVFIKYLKSAFETPESRDHIKEWLVDNLCHNIPEEEVKEQCEKLVETYGDTFFEAVVGGLNPQTACMELGACTRKGLSQILRIDTLASIDNPDELPSLVVSPKSPEEKQRQTPNGPSTVNQTRPSEQSWLTQVCDDCIEVVSQIDDYLSNHPIDDNVSVLASQVCDKLPSSTLTDKCKALLKVLGNDITTAVATMDNPRGLCTRLELCQKEKKTRVLQFRKPMFDMFNFNL